MRTIQPNSIHIAADRQRKAFDEKSLNELGASIVRLGLFHKPVLRETIHGLTLVSGERRLRAIKDIFDLGGTFEHDGTRFSDLIPYSLFSELDPLAAEEAELEENIRRANLTWQESALATKRLADLRAAQARSAGAPPPTTGDIALEVQGSREGRYQEATRRELIVADHLDDPEVRAAKNPDEAFKVLRRKESIAKNIVLAEKVGKTYSADLHTAINGDTVEWLDSCEDGKFDVILTDPPYGMGADEFGDSGGRAAGAHGYEDSEEYFTSLMFIVLPELSRITKPQAHLYLFCDLYKFTWLQKTLYDLDWWVHRTPLIWYKPSTRGRVPWSEHGPRRHWEMILYAVKGKRPVTKIMADVITCDTEANQGNSAQKPVDLYINLLTRSVRPGDSVVDLFSGTGTIFPAAQEMKCYATGVERDPAQYALGLKRIEKLKEQPELEGLV